MNKSYPVNLPVTAFPQRCKSGREQELQDFWRDRDVYQRNLEQRQGQDKFVLHDGPPYLSSDKIHIGHALNKVLKDIVTRYKAQQGFYAPFVPGYDSHGLPIENAVLKEVKGGRSALTPVELRGRCREFALKNLKGQEAQFKRLGVWGDWDHPYVTLDRSFEAAQVRVFGKMAADGYLYKGLKPVHWCPTCETALADAEVEHNNHLCDAVYVLFPFEAGSWPEFVPAGVSGAFAVWTTTPWTLPANVALAVRSNLRYQFLQTEKHGVMVVAEPLLDAFVKTVGLADVQVLGTVEGKELEGWQARHPLFDRVSPVVLSDHVTSDQGTGVVHIAPGHGPEDFAVGRANKLAVLCPVDGHGVLTEAAGCFAGQRFDKANSAVVAQLEQSGKLLHHAQLTHEYPHCWRCKKPLIFRATEQWFASVDAYRQAALAAIDSVEWVPARGRNRIYDMVERRSDWCISRQRAWGVPIPVFSCNSCGHHLMTAESVGRVANVFEREGSDTWWQHDATYFLGDGFACGKCGERAFTKETDVMDVWFDSGVSHAAVVDLRPELRGTPFELALEGSDQHRGWYQSLLLTSMALHGRAPYKTVVTHGFVLDDKGRKMAKSEGNVVNPDDVVKQYGADVLRLWVSSVNYTDDARIGKDMLAQLAKVYEKLRNTMRFLLGNLNDFNPATDSVSVAELSSVDRFVLHRLSELVAQVQDNFDKYEFYRFHQLLQNFCVVDLSSFYFDVVKDRLYTHGKKSVSRRGAQTVLEHVLQVLVRLLVPVTPHLAEDVWQHMPELLRRSSSGEESVLLTSFPSDAARFRNDELAALWSDLLTVRSVSNKALEQARTQKKIGKTAEARAVLSVENAQLLAKLQGLGDELTSVLMTSQATVGPAPTSDGEVLAQVSEHGVTVTVLAAHGTKCLRCWHYRTNVGSDDNYPELCAPCAGVLAQESSLSSTPAAERDSSPTPAKV